MSRVVVLTGGSTPERDVALAGAAQVVAALRDRGHEVAVADTVHGPLDEHGERELLVDAVAAEPPDAAELARLAAREDLPALFREPPFRRSDLVFLVLHGRQGEGGEVQTLLEMAGLRYTGSGPVGSALAMDKEVAKRLFRDAAIPTPEWVMLPASDDAVAALGLPTLSSGVADATLANGSARELRLGVAPAPGQLVGLAIDLDRSTVDEGLAASAPRALLSAPAPIARDTVLARGFPT